MLKKLHPSFLKKNGRREFAVLPYGEFEELEELLQDAYDIRRLEEARRKNAGKRTFPLAEARKRLGL
jgi:hypothetical protein